MSQWAPDLDQGELGGSAQSSIVSKVEDASSPASAGSEASSPSFVAPSGSSASGSAASGSSGAPGASGPAGSGGRARVRVPWWIRVVPFFLSAFFFLSALFAVFSPLPILLLSMRSGRKWAWLSALTNTAIVFAAAGAVSTTIYLVFSVSLALALSELLYRRKSLERAAVLSLVTMGLAGIAAIAIYSKVHHVNGIHEIKAQLSAGLDYVAQNVPAASPDAATDGEALSDWKHDLMVELPSGIAVFSLLMVWANLLILLRVNPGGLRERLGLDAAFFRRWRTPEWLVWPTIASGALLLMTSGRVSDVALNFFKFFMAIYTIQGLSILSFFFDLWNLRGIFRTAGFLIGIFVMMPLLLSLGFFDLWFDFRGKFRQS